MSDHVKVIGILWVIFGAFCLCLAFFALLFFPIEVVAPVVFGMAWIDPLCGELRRRNSRLYPNLPKVAYFVLVLAVMTATVGLSIGVLVAAAIAAPVAVSVEKAKTRFLDDDFTMIVIPLMVIAIVFLVFSIG